MIIEYSTALSLFESGKLDFQETVPYKELPRYRGNPGLHIVPSLSIYYYGFNVKKPPFDNLCFAVNTAPWPGPTAKADKAP